MAVTSQLYTRGYWRTRLQTRGYWDPGIFVPGGTGGGPSDRRDILDRFPQPKTIKEKLKVVHDAKPVISVTLGGDVETIVGTRYRISAGFSLGKYPIDPVELQLTVGEPDDGKEVFVFGTDEALQRASTGLYFIELVAEAAGVIKYRWSSTAIGQEAQAEGEVKVLGETDLGKLAEMPDDWLGGLHNQLSAQLSKIAQLTAVLKMAINEAESRSSQAADQEDDSWLDELRERLEREFGRVLR